MKESKALEHFIEQNNECQYDISFEEETDETVVHKAIGILRKRILDNKTKLENEYYAPDELSSSSQLNFVDPLLYKAICWLQNEKSYRNATEFSDKKCLTIACDLMSLVTAVPSPKHLGLAIHLYNEFGSKHLVEDMHCMGYSISYPELRMFLSSAAAQAIDHQKVTASGGLVPENITNREHGGRLIVGVADNWDHNERTCDGKGTTHAMTSILVSSQSNEDVTIPRLPRTGNRTFNSKTLPGGSLCSVIPYHKPANRPCPVFDPPVTLNEIKPDVSQSVKIAMMKELLYALGRTSVFCDDISEIKTVPHWNIFQSKTSHTETKVSNIAYNPIIMANPTDYSTVYTTLLRTKEVLNELGQSYVPVVFDMGLLTKALEIVWNECDDLKGVIPIEGGMHMLMSVFAGIGYLYGDAGLRDLLTESEVFASATVNNILAGKDFERGISAFKLIDEALTIRFLKNFEAWCEDNEKEINQEVAELLKTLRSESCFSGAEHDIEEMCTTLSEHIVPLIDEFRTECRSISPTFMLWDDYLTKVSMPLKLFISSTRAPNWKVQLYSKLQLMPLFFASNRNTYARYLTFQILQLNRLPTEVENEFIDGMYTANLSGGKFSNVWMDYTLEVTQNKDLKGAGGVIGLTLKENALARWFSSRPLASKYSAAFHNSISSMKQDQQNEHKHHSDTHSKTQLHDKSVTKLLDMFESNIIDPFDVNKCPQKLINFATGVEATEDIENSLVGCLETGAKLFETFVSERLIAKIDGSDPPAKKFFSPMTRSKVVTMAEMKKKPVKLKKSDTIRREVMFQRLLAINSYKKIPLQRVFSFENTMVPMSMFNEQGKMLKSKKSDFMSKLESLLPGNISFVGNIETVIFDGMAVIQLLQTQCLLNTFLDMAVSFMKYILMKARTISGVMNIHIVFDKYMTLSPKSETRKARGDVASKSIHIQSNLRVPKDWKFFVCSGTNKERLAEYYTAYLKENASNYLASNETLIVNGGNGESCLKITSDYCCEIPALKSNQEEADTVMVLHAKYAAETGTSSLVIQSPDTDVLILLLHHYRSIGIKSLYMSTGRVTTHTDHRRFIPIHLLIEKLSDAQLSIILAVYCLTGCDSTSSFFGKGKKSVFNQMLQYSEKYLDMKDLGEKLCLTKMQKIACTLFIVNLYGGHDNQSLTELRCKMALQSKHPRNLPPTEDSFNLHCLRCVVQLWIWRHATIGIHDVTPFTKFGYTINEDSSNIHPTLMSRPAAAPELLNDFTCECVSCDDNCTCFINQQPCTVACLCTANLQNGETMCTNIHTLSAVLSNDDLSTDEDEDDNQM